MIQSQTKKIFSLILFLLLSLFPTDVFCENMTPTNEEITSFLTRLFRIRTELLINPKADSIKGFYNSERLSKYAFLHEVQRATYINAWAKTRGLKFTDCGGNIRIVKINVAGDIVKVYLLHSLKLSYVYPGEIKKPQSFGIGTRHFIKLKKTMGSYHVLSEWYSDPLEENPQLIPSGLAKNVSNQHSFPMFKKEQKLRNTKLRCNREKAVAYANKYAGAAWGAGNNHRYNPKYKEYNFSGGDCTNFASQVLGDPEGGGLLMRDGWHYQSKQGGSIAWIRTDALKNFLLYSGYGQQIARDTITMS